MSAAQHYSSERGFSSKLIHEVYFRTGSGMSQSLQRVFYVGDFTGLGSLFSSSSLNLVTQGSEAEGRERNIFGKVL